MPVLFNPLTATAQELQTSLTTAKVSSLYPVEVYFAQIQQHNDYLKAVIATVPRPKLVARAKELDAERAAGKVSSVLHWIPILI
jgi:amidase